MPECRLVTAAENNGDCSRLQDATNDSPQEFLRMLNRGVDADIAHVERRFLRKVPAAYAIPRGLAVEEAADLARSFSCPRPAAVAAHPLILRKADQYGAAGPQRGGIAAPEFHDFPQSWIVGA